MLTQGGAAQRIAASLIAVSSWIAVGAVVQRCVSIEKGNLIAAFLRYAAYLSHWSVALTAIMFSIIVCKPAAIRAWWWVGQIVIVDTAMSLGYWARSSLHFFVEQSIDLKFMHAVLPLLVFLYWVLFTEHGKVTVLDAVIWLAMPLVYTAWMELYGLFSGVYAYEQLNPFFFGRFNVVFSVAEILAVTAMISGLLYIIDRSIPFLTRRRRL